MFSIVDKPVIVTKGCYHSIIAVQAMSTSTPKACPTWPQTDQLMTKNHLRSLLKRLSPFARAALEAAANNAFTRTHHEVDVEHVLLECHGSAGTDIPVALQGLGIDTVSFENDLRNALDRFRSGSTRTPVLSTIIPRWLDAAWVLASVDCGSSVLRSGHLLAVLIVDEGLRRSVGTALDRLAGIQPDELMQQLPNILRHSTEQESWDRTNSESVRAVPYGDKEWAAGSPTPSLDRFTVDLTAQARAGRLDPVLGREGEIRQMMDILLRRRQNNPILTGEPGVGKTAVAEGLAARIAQGDVPEPLKRVALRTLDLGLLQAGASVKGEFENRLRGVIDEVKASLTPIILFIDEAHTMVGAGGPAGQSDAANLLKPALARGELRTIAATTWAEYKKYFEKDAALARRFQVVKVEEPSEDSAIQMVRGIAVSMETHHNVRILEEAVVDAVRLSCRYISGRQLPDKAISVLDTACARVALSRASIPAALEDVNRLLENLHREETALRRELEDTRHQQRLADIAVERERLLEAQTEQQSAFLEQKQLVEEIQGLRSQLVEVAKSPEATESGLHTRLEAPLRRLRELHRRQPLIYDCVDGATVAEVISGWTGIPLGRMVTDEIHAVRRLDTILGERVLGQAHALQIISKSLQAARAGLEDPIKPKGVFLLVGPSGVGKTETALALADALYGGEKNLVSINLSEYQEAHTVSGLKGSPPGYVGYGEGGVLTEAIRRKPHSVLLLDEVEKAHPDVLEIFYQIFDRGQLEDAEGREIDFRHTVIILTSNIGSEMVLRAVEHGVTVNGKSRRPTPEDLVELLRPQLVKSFKPAFLGRLTVVPYFPVQDDVLKDIIRLKLDRLRRRVEAHHGVAFTHDPALVDHLATRCTEVESGARNADAIISALILGDLSDHLLCALAEARKLRKISLRLRKGNVVTHVS